MKLWDIITSAYHDALASGTAQPNGKVAQDIQFLDQNGNPIYMSINDSGQIRVDIGGATLVIEGDVTVDNIKIYDSDNNLINPATKDLQQSIINLLTNIKVSQNQKIDNSSQTITATISAGGNGTLTITPPVGYLMKINSIYMSAPAVVGATSGTHSFTLYGSVGVLCIATSQYNQSLYIKGLLPYIPSVMKFPTTEGGFISSIKDIWFDNANPLTMQYNNATNASTGNSPSRNYTVQYELVPETTF